MCTVIGCDHGHGKSSVGVSAEGVLAVLGVLTAVAIGGAIFQALWVPIGFALAVGLLLAYDTSRRVTFAVCGALVAGGLWLARFAYRRLRKPSRAVALPQTYRAALYVQTPRERRELGSGLVPGRWVSATDVETETMRRYVAVHGYPPVGTLCCKAEPAG